MANFRVVGKPLPRLDGPETVTGRAAYTVDVLLPGMLHAKLFRSSVPHAKIRRLDASRARLLTGVAAVLTASDVPRKRFGFTVQMKNCSPARKRVTSATSSRRWPPRTRKRRRPL